MQRISYSLQMAAGLGPPIGGVAGHSFALGLSDLGGSTQQTKGNKAQYLGTVASACSRPTGHGTHAASGTTRATDDTSAAPLRTSLHQVVPGVPGRFAFVPGATGNRKSQL